MNDEWQGRETIDGKRERRHGAMEGTHRWSREREGGEREDEGERMSLLQELLGGNVKKSEGDVSRLNR